MRRVAVVAVLLALAAPSLAALTCGETKWGDNAKQPSPLKTALDVPSKDACAELCNSTPGCTNFKYCRTDVGTTNVCTEHYTRGGPDLKPGECRLGSGALELQPNDGSYGGIVLGIDCKSDGAAAAPAAAAPAPAAVAAPAPAVAAKPGGGAAVGKPDNKAPAPAPTSGKPDNKAPAPAPTSGVTTLPGTAAPAPAPAAATTKPAPGGVAGGKPDAKPGKPTPPAPAPAVAAPAPGKPAKPPAKGPAPAVTLPAPVAPAPGVNAPAPAPTSGVTTLPECVKPGEKQPRGKKLPECPPAGNGGGNNVVVVVPPIYKPPVAECYTGPQPRGGASKPVCPDTVLPITPGRPPTCILPGQPQPRDANALPLCPPPVTGKPPIADCVPPGKEPRGDVNVATAKPFVCPPTVTPITPEVRPQCILPGQPQPRDADALPLCPVPLEPESPAPAPAPVECLKPGDKQPRGKNLPPCVVEPAPMPTAVPGVPIVVPPRPTTKPTPKPTEQPPPETPSPYLPPENAKPLPGVPGVQIRPPTENLPSPALPVVPQAPPPPGEPAPAPPQCEGGKKPVCKWFVRDVPCCAGQTGLSTDKPAVQLELLCSAPITLPPECVSVRFGANRAIKSSYWPAFNSYTSSNFRFILNHVDNEPLYAETEKGTLDAQVSVDVQANRDNDKLPQCSLPLATPCTAGGERVTTVEPVDRITWTSTVYKPDSPLFKGNAAVWNVTAQTPWNNYAWSLPPPKQARDGKPVDGPLCEEVLLWDMEPRFWSEAGFAKAKGKQRECSVDAGLGVGYVGGGGKPQRPKL